MARGLISAGSRSSLKGYRRSLLGNDWKATGLGYLTNSLVSFTPSLALRALVQLS